MPKRKLTGEIVSDAMRKTVVVLVSTQTQHPKYKRYIRIHKRYKAHDESNAYHVGDRVVIEETHPLSKDKRWNVIEKL
jgi:small subunit ribosomal protein S17